MQNYAKLRKIFLKKASEACVYEELCNNEALPVQKHDACCWNKRRVDSSQDELG